METIQLQKKKMPMYGNGILPAPISISTIHEGPIKT